ncbi:unnamed protein product [Trichobilharzia regenti]|nr:unnamed protein product [Trichobilharzia regenti]
MSNIHFIATQVPESNIPRFIRIVDNPENTSGEDFSENNDEITEEYIDDSGHTTPIIENPEIVRSPTPSSKTESSDDICPPLRPIKSRDYRVYSRNSVVQDGLTQHQQQQHDSESLKAKRKPENPKCIKFKKYLKRLIVFLFSHIGLCLVVVGYCSLGAVLFRSIEKSYQADVIRNKTTELMKQQNHIQRLLVTFHQDSLEMCTEHVKRWYENEIKWKNEMIRILLSYGFPTNPKDFEVEFEKFNKLSTKPITPTVGNENTSETYSNMDVLNNLHRNLTINLKYRTEHIMFNTTGVIKNLVQATYAACDAGWRPVQTNSNLPVHKKFESVQSQCYKYNNCTLYNSSDIQNSDNNYDTNSPRNKMCTCTNGTLCPCDKLNQSRNYSDKISENDIVEGYLDPWTLTGALLYSVTVITTIGKL